MINDLHNYFYKIEIPEKLKDSILYESDKNRTYIEPLSKINIFIGPNNSGKSLFIRELLKSGITSEYFDDENNNNINLLIGNTLQKCYQIFDKYNAVKFSSNSYSLVPQDLSTILKSLSDTNNFETFINSINISKLSKLNHSYQTFEDKNGTTRTIPDQNTINKFKELIVSLKDQIIFYRVKEKINRLYAPTLRTLRVYDNKLILTNKTQQEYQLDEESNNKNRFHNNGIFIENGQDFFDSVLELLTRTKSSRNRLMDFEKFLEKEFFDGQDITITPNTHEKVIKIKVGQEKEESIFNLGDGLQMLIILTFPLFKYDSGIFVIEEPELFVHPGLQKRLINLYVHHPRAKNFMLFIATHSNHIIDCINYSNQFSLFSVQKKLQDGEDEYPKFVIRNLSYGDNTILHSLGVTNTSVFLSNCTIWVEGVTDKLYIQKYIECYLDNPNLNPKYNVCKRFQEGVNYSFIYSGGDNILHLDFDDETLIHQVSHKSAIKYLCGKAMVIVDNDNEKNLKRKELLGKQLGFNFIILPVIEIENLLPLPAIFGAIQTFSTYKNIVITDENKYSETDYADVRLGSFIDNHLLAAQDTRKRKKFSVKASNESEGNLTINCKVVFCEKAKEHITYQNMTASSIKVVEDILDFFITNNAI